MRRGELFAQDWADVDLPRKLLYVTCSKTPEGQAREIPLTERLYQLLKKREGKSGLVFTYNKQKIGDLKTSWNTAKRKANIAGFRFHDLRHTFNTRLMEAGVISDVRMALMGHEPRSVHWSYTHVELPLKRQAIEKLQAYMAEQKRKLRRVSKKLSAGQG